MRWKDIFLTFYVKGQLDTCRNNSAFSNAVLILICSYWKEYIAQNHRTVRREKREEYFFFNLEDKDIAGLNSNQAFWIKYLQDVVQTGHYQFNKSLHYTPSNCVITQAVLQLACLIFLCLRVLWVLYHRNLCFIHWFNYMQAGWRKFYILFCWIMLIVSSSAGARLCDSTFPLNYIDRQDLGIGLYKLKKL